MKYLINLTDDIDEIKSLGSYRVDQARAKGLGAGFGKKTFIKDGYERHISNVKGKFAVYKGIGKEPVAVRNLSDEALWFYIYGGIWKGWVWQVRWSKWTTGQLMHQPERHYLETRCGTPIDILLLVVPHQGETIVRIAGWIRVSEFIKIWSKCHFAEPDEEVWCVGQDKLSPFESFINIDPKHPLREDIIAGELDIKVEKCRTTNDFIGMLKGMENE